jgi:hypothetical protein
MLVLSTWAEALSQAAHRMTGIRLPQAMYVMVIELWVAILRRMRPTPAYWAVRLAYPLSPAAWFLLKSRSLDPQQFAAQRQSHLHRLRFVCLHCPRKQSVNSLYIHVCVRVGIGAERYSNLLVFVRDTHAPREKVRQLACPHNHFSVRYDDAT